MQLSPGGAGGCTQDCTKRSPLGTDPAPSSVFQTWISTPCCRHLGFEKKRRKIGPAVLQPFFPQWGGSWIFVGKGPGGTAVSSQGAQRDATSYRGDLMKVPPGLSRGCLLWGDAQHGFPPAGLWAQWMQQAQGTRPSLPLLSHSVVAIKAPLRPILPLHLCAPRCVPCL